MNKDTERARHQRDPVQVSKQEKHRSHGKNLYDSNKVTVPETFLSMSPASVYRPSGYDSSLLLVLCSVPLVYVSLL